MEKEKEGRKEGTGGKEKGRESGIGGVKNRVVFAGRMWGGRMLVTEFRGSPAILC